jgi:hypothetical protein
MNLAKIAWELGRLDEALAHAREGAAGMRRIGDPIGLAWSLYYAAAVAAARGDPHRAGVLLGVVERVFEEASGAEESLESMAAVRDAIFERASPEERTVLLEGMRAEPAPGLEQAVSEAFPNL